MIYFSCKLKFPELNFVKLGTYFACVLCTFYKDEYILLIRMNRSTTVPVA